MNSRDSFAPQHHHQHHQTTAAAPGMMMPPANSYPTHHHSHHHHQQPNNSNAQSANNNNNVVSPNSGQNRFPFNANEQFGDGSSPSGGFRAGNFSVEPARKKRGRPRKYSPSSDGNIALGLAPAPVAAVGSAAATGGGGGSGGGGNFEGSNDGGGGENVDSGVKKNRGRPAGSGKKQMDALGAPGIGFTPHVIVVKAGEDIASKIMAFSQQGPRTICILSANGAISNVTLRQAAMSGGTVTYEGRFEIISLSGTFQSMENNGNRSTATGMSVSLAGSDGRVLGGGVAGTLVAATPVQVVVGSFIADGKKPKSSSGPSSVPPPSMLNFSSGPTHGISPPSEGPSSESSDESGGSPHHQLPGSYNNNASQHQHQQQHQHQHQHQHQQQQPQQQQPGMQNLQMYSNMGWPNSTMNMLPN